MERHDHRSSTTAAPTTHPTSAPSADYQVIDWSVFVAEPTVDHANSADSIKSTFPSFVITRRSNAQADQAESGAQDSSIRLGEQKPNDPMPIGVIRVLGGAVPSAKFDVLLNISSGDFESQWPRAESRTNRLLWSNLIASDDAPSMEQLGDSDWMKHLRDANSHYLTTSGETHGERFLMYDPSPLLPVAIKVETSGDNAYKITNIGSPDLADFEIYKGKADGWRTARIDALVGTHIPVAKPAAAGNEPKIAANDTLSITTAGLNGEDDSVRSIHVGSNGNISLPGIGNINVAGKTTDEARDAITETFKTRNMPVGDIKVEITPAAGSADAKPTTAPSGPATPMALSANPVSDPKQLLAAWKDRLNAAGLQPTDVEVILNILGKYAVDPGRLTAVYRLSSSQMNDLMPMEIVPAPAKITRVGLVVLRNIDPAINDEIDQLVKNSLGMMNGRSAKRRRRNWWPSVAPPRVRWRRVRTAKTWKWSGAANRSCDTIEEPVQQ